MVCAPPANALNPLSKKIKNLVAPAITSRYNVFDKKNYHQRGETYYDTRRITIQV